MRKRQIPERQIDLASITIGIGPNFVAGATVHLIVESSWDGGLGNVVTIGTALPLAGGVREIMGLGAERIIYAPVAGVFETRYEIGASILAGEVVARIDHIEIRAPLEGRLRGLTHSGVPVDRGMKVVEIDPRREDALVAVPASGRAG